MATSDKGENNPSIPNVDEKLLKRLAQMREETDAMADFSQQILKSFKELNGITERTSKTLGNSANFAKDILTDTKAREKIESAILSNIESSEKTILGLKMAKYNTDVRDQLVNSEISKVSEQTLVTESKKASLLEEQVRLVAEQIDYAKSIEKYNKSIEATDKSILENRQAILESQQRQSIALSKVQEIEADIAEAQRAAIHDGIVDEEAYDKLLRMHTVAQRQFNIAKEGSLELITTGANLERGRLILAIDMAKVQEEQAAGLERIADVTREINSLEAQMNDLVSKRNKLKQEGLTDSEIDALIKLKQQEIEREQLASRMYHLQVGYLAYLEKSSNGADGMLGQLGGMVSKAKQFGETIKLIPIQFILLTKLISLGLERFKELDAAAEAFRKETGFTNTQMVELRKDAEAINKEFAGFGVKIENAYKAAAALTNVFGRTSLVSKEAMQNVALMAANLGVAEGDAAEVLSIFQGIGGATEQSAMNVMKVGAGLSEKTGVPFSKVMGDIAKASGTTAMLLGTNPSKLMKAAIAARALGTDLNALAAQQERLLDYSSSINDELSASAMLGRSISFQKARQLAYEGKIDESAKATLETIKEAGDFNEMSIYQRKELAKAAGMDLKELTKMMAVENQRNAILTGNDEAKKETLKKQEKELENLKKLNKLDEEDLVKQNEKALTQAKIQGLMTQLNQLMDGMKTAFANIIEPIITPIAKILVPILKVVTFLFGGIAKIIGAILEPISWVVDGITQMVDGTGSLSKGWDFFAKQFDGFWGGVLTVAKIVGSGILLTMFFGSEGPSKLMEMIKAPFKMAKNLGSSLMSKVTGKGAGAAADMIGPKLPTDAVKGAGDATKGVTDATKGVSDAAKSTERVPAGTGIKEFLKNLADGLKEMAGVQVLKGALNLIPASLGFIAMIPGFVGVKLLENIDGEKLKTALTGLAAGLKEMGTGSVAKGALVMLLASLGFVAMTLGSIGLGAVALLGEAAGAGLVGLSVGLMALSGAGIGVLVLLGISAAFIGFAYAAKLVSEAIVNVAKILPDAIGPLTQLAIISPLLYVAAGGIGALATSLGVLAAMTIPATIASLAIYVVAKSVGKLGENFEAVGKGMITFTKGIKASIDPIKQIAQIRLGDSAEGMKQLSSALASFGVGSAVAGIGSFVGNFLGGDPIAKMERLASISEKLKVSADAISSIAVATSRFSTVDSFAKSVGTLADSLDKLSDSLGKIKTEELAKLSAIGNATPTTETTTAKTAEQTAANMAGVEAKLDKLTELLVGGAVRVYIDGKNVSAAMANTAGR